jgi:LuxR family maltose regulon positive regulatory protein
LDIDGDPTYLHEMEYIVFARILIAKGRLDEADRLLQRLLETAEAGGRTSRVIEILILQALSSQAGGDITRAMTTLEKALSLAEPGGFIRTFIDEGPPIKALLKKMKVEDGKMKGYTQNLITAFTDKAQQPSSTSPQPLIEPLSDREIEVLQLIAEGLTNPEVGSRLYLSLHTVKTHTRNIYGKLGAHNRTEAVAKARALGVLPST